ncbi:MAG: ATP-dependent helicase [Desulfobacterota bacterium]|nr:ATP-dependent helicase [Thermodesulfobacteriota bacterium]
MAKIHYTKELNAAQLEAVQAPDGPILVIAGAGSGKTRTLVYRVAWLVEQGVDPGRILLLTFTRKAAQEMLLRVEGMLGASCREISGGTYHALAYRILRRYGSALGLSGPLTVMDRADALEAAGRLAKSLGLDKKGLLPGKKDFVELMSRIANRGEAFEPGVRRFAPQWELQLPQLARWRQAFEEYKRSRSLLDYDDLLVLILQLFSEQPRIAEKYSQQYRYVLVDEYQDTNLLQARMVQDLVRVHGNILVVGDDSQSIYGFRGAHFQNILDFPRLFPGTRVVKLEENYRSSQAILNLANKIISFAPQRYSKCLRAHFPQGEPPRTLEFAYEENQSQFVVRQVRDLANRGVPLREMAVLFRAGHHSFNLEIHLQKNGIPFTKYGGQRLTEGAHIKDLLSYLKVVQNPLDSLSWERILQHLEGLGPKRAGEIVERLAALPDWPERIRLFREYPRLQPQLSLLGEVLATLVTGPLRPAEALETVWVYYHPFLSRLYEDTERRVRDIEELLRVSQGYGTLDDFLADLLLEVNESQEEAEKDRLLLSTVHSAKPSGGGCGSGMSLVVF